MRHTTLGSSGCSISRVALGTMTFGQQTAEPEAFAQLDRFTQAGGTLLDTADAYGGGTSERIVGRWIASKPAHVRDEIVLATKARFPTGPGTNDVGLSRKHLAQALDASLERLGVETIDLYQAHSFDPHTPIEETLRFLDDAVRAGKIHYVGLSNFTAWQVQRVVDVASFGGLVGPSALQAQYNLLTRELEWEIMPALEANGLGLLVWSPLAAGVLTGRRPLDGLPVARLEQAQAVLKALGKIAERRGVPSSRVALAWLAAQPAVSSVILGARTLQQLEDNLAAFDLVLEAGELALLAAASTPVTGDYPYGERGLEQRSRKLEGGR
ncbi:aldo/keto reductase [Nonomuraea sp. K274]|uniref:Aldo/keto reductase n=1 Tax=Nonomuraea cypriaca TaxID=1187855 RepID=A0A931AHH6_9ACTN|nr:aldo/keto reductase [Nonomuraea cypriaca]MBF8190225.1 aldo/keto reductase [Nonomuraea cypriaca]